MEESKKQQLAHYNYSYGSKMPIGSRERSLYEQKKESFINGINSVLNKIEVDYELIKPNEETH